MVKKQEVVKSAQMGLAERPDWMGDSERGSEEVGINDLTIPRLSMIQGLSPQLRKNKAEYIEGSEEGMLFNTVTNELYPEPVIFVPVFFQLEWVVWKNRDAGGGFISAHATQDEAVKTAAQHPDAGRTTDKGEPVIEVQDTAQHYGLLVDPSRPDAKAAEIVISMSKSQLKPSRQFNSQIKLAGGDRWERYYRLSAVTVQNAKGQDYQNWKVEQMGYVSQAVAAQAESLYEAVKEGRRTVERDRAADSPTSTDNEGDDDNM